MSLIICVYVPTGIVLSGDSRTTGTITQAVSRPTPEDPDATVTVQTNVVISDAADKVFVVFDKYGVGTFGTALVNKMPIAHYVERFQAETVPVPTSTETCAKSLLHFFRSLKPVPESGFIVAGYDDGQPNVFAVNIGKHVMSQINANRKNPQQRSYGIARGGDTAIVDRLLSQKQFNPMFDAMNLQDAVDYSRHLIRSTIDQMRFEPRFPSVGGAIDTLVVRPSEIAFLKRKELTT